MDSSALKEMVIRAKNGNSEALTELYNETQGLVYCTALKLVKNEADAQDIAQDTYIKAFSSLSTLQNEQTFIKWLLTIAANASKNYLKKSKPMLFEDDEKEALTINNIPEVSEDFLPQEHVDKIETIRLIDEIIDGLPDKQRTAVMLYYLDGLSIQEVAEIMETSDGTIKSRLNYARKKIKDDVEEHERKGTKLYGLAGLPLLSQILRIISKNYAIPAEAGKVILEASIEAATVASTASATANAAAETTAGTAAATGTAATAEGATVAGSAATGIIAKFIAAPLITKIIIGAVAVGIAVSAGNSINKALNDSTETPRQTLRETSETPNNLENLSSIEGREWSEFLGITKDELIALMGTPSEESEDGYTAYYHDDKNRIEFIFFNDGLINQIVLRGEGVSTKGITTGISLRQAQEIMDAHEDISFDIMSDEGKKIRPNTISYSYFAPFNPDNAYINNSCSWVLSYGENEILDSISITINRAIYELPYSDNINEFPWDDDSKYSYSITDSDEFEEFLWEELIGKSKAYIITNHGGTFCRNNRLIYSDWTGGALLINLHEDIAESVEYYGEDFYFYSMKAGESADQVRIKLANNPNVLEISDYTESDDTIYFVFFTNGYKYRVYCDSDYVIKHFKLEAGPKKQDDAIDILGTAVAVEPWQDAYAEFLRNPANLDTSKDFGGLGPVDGVQFFLYSLTGKEIPQLIVGNYYRNMYMYNEQGQVSTLHEGYYRYFGIPTDKELGGLFGEEGGEGASTTIWLGFPNGWFMTIHCAEWYKALEKNSPTSEAALVYKVNGKEVSESEYFAEIDSTPVTTYTVNEENINKVIYGWETMEGTGNQSID